MKRLATTVSLIALAASLAACSSGTKSDKSAGSPTPQATKSAALLTEAQAKAALPVVADLPAGFKTDEYSHNDLPGGCPAVDAAVKAEQALKPTYVGASFSKDDSGYSVDTEIAILPSAEAAKTLLQTYQRAFVACPSWKVTQEGESGTIGVKVEGNPQVGDLALLLTLSGDVSGQKYGGSQYVAQVGNTLSFASEGGPEGHTDDPKVELPGVISSMVNKLKAA